MLRTITLYIKDNSIYKIEHPFPHRLGIVCLPVQQNSSITYMYMYKSTLSHRGFDNSPLLIVFSVKYIDQTKISYVLKYFGSFDMFDLFNLKRPHVRGELFYHLQKFCNTFILRYLIGQNHDTISKLQSLYKVHMNTISNGELSDSVNRVLNLVRLMYKFSVPIWLKCFNKSHLWILLVCFTMTVENNNIWISLTIFSGPKMRCYKFGACSK